MKNRLLSRALVFLLLVMGAGQLARAQSDAALERVLNQMDAAAKNFHTTQANFVWQIYTAVVKEITDTQKGTIYFRRNGNEIQVAVDITSAPPKYLLLTGGSLQIYDIPQDHVTVYSLGKNRPEFESFLQLGFGGGGHSLLSSFDVTYGGTEQIGGKETSRLDLIPKTTKAEQMFPHIVLWIDPARGVSVRQQLFQGEGDYRLADYSNIDPKPKIPDNVFKLKTDRKTTRQDMSQQ